MPDLDHETLLRRSREVLNILAEWKIPAAEQPALLGLPEDVRYRHLDRYRGDTPLPDEPGVQQRVDHLLGIAEALHTTYPRNPNMGPLWMKSGCRQFGGRKPMAILIEDGIAGLETVRSHLDCAYEWEQDENKHRQ